jgi:sorting nexin-29
MKVCHIEFQQNLRRAYGIHMTTNCAEVKLRNVLFRQFDIKEGVIQGDPLACLIFNISLEKVIRDAEVERVFSTSVQILAYADDIATIGHSLAVVKETLISLEKAAKEIGLTINENKTKFTVLNNPAY